MKLKQILKEANWQFLNGVKSFPVGDQRYEVISQDYQQPKGSQIEQHGTMDNFDAAKKYAESLIPDKADVVSIVDRVRGFVVAKLEL